MTSPGTALTRNDVTGSHVSGTGSHVTGSDHVCMCNRFPRFFHTLVVPLRDPEGVILEGWGAHTQPEVAQYLP